MSVRPAEEILSVVRGIIGDRTDDETLGLLEDLSDTLNHRLNEEGEDWKVRYEQNDAEWRRRYTDRFFNPGGADTVETVIVPEEEDLQVPDGPTTYEELFKEE